MSVYTKSFSLVIFACLTLASITALGMTTTNTTELYAETIKMERSSAEIPTSIGASNGNNAAVQDEYVVESTADLNDAPVAPKMSKKVSSAKTKKNAKN